MREVKWVIFDITPTLGNAIRAKVTVSVYSTPTVYIYIYIYIYIYVCK